MKKKQNCSRNWMNFSTSSIILTISSWKITEWISFKLSFTTIIQKTAENKHQISIYISVEN